MAAKCYLVSFATEQFASARARLVRSALKVGGIDAADSWDVERLRLTEFYGRNERLLAERRGAGYWAWKPFIILECLRAANPGDWVVYSDAGSREGNYFCLDVRPLLNWVSERLGGMMPGVYIPQFGPNSMWTKRDCFVGMGCDSELYWDHCQIQAGASVWRCGERSATFLREWLGYCEQRALISDDPNVLGADNLGCFRDHRHDQSILTNLCLKRGVRAFGSPTKVTECGYSFNFLIDVAAGRHWSSRISRVRRAAVSASPAWARRALRGPVVAAFGRLFPNLRHLLDHYNQSDNQSRGMSGLISNGAAAQRRCTGQLQTAMQPPATNRHYPRRGPARLLADHAPLL